MFLNKKLKFTILIVMCKNKVLIFDIGESMIFLFLLVPFLENKLISTNFQNEHDVCVLMITALLESEGVKSPLKDEIINNVKSNKGRERLVGRSNDIFYGLTFRKVNSENKILVSSALDDVKVVSLSDCLRNYVLNEVFFENKLNIEIDCSESRSYTMILTDIEGKVIKTLTKNKVIQLGKHQLPFDVADLAPGMYLLQVNTQYNELKVKRIIKK